MLLHDESMTKGEVETEIKLRIADRAAVVRRLGEFGFGIIEPRLFEANELYERRGGPSLREQGQLLRLRLAGKKGVLTWKGQSQAGPHKSRPEIETTVGDFSAMERILDQLGFERTFRYEKYRTEYAAEEHPGGVVTVDETPIGDFLELEGGPEWIDRIAGMLGYSPDEYVLKTYGALFLEHCAEVGAESRGMVFSGSAQPGSAH